MPAYDRAALRAEEFSWAARGEAVYLNNASTGPLPRRAVRAVEHALQLRTLPSRFTDAMLWDTLATGRGLAARLIGASPREVALCTNTSHGVNLAAFSLPLRPGDVVIAPDGEFPANVYPWMAAAEQRGFEYRRLPVDADGVVHPARILAALDDANVRALAISWVSFTSGYRYDLATLGRACRERGIHFVVDAIQGLGAAALDVHACSIDILACGAQKWLLGPWGTGFTFVREALIEHVPPHLVGWTEVEGSDDFSRLLDYDLTWRSDARRYEALTLPFGDVFGFIASLELLLEAGPADVGRHVAELAQRIVDWARAHDVPLATPADPAHRAGIVSLRLSDAHAMSARLTAAGVAHSLREGLVRLSPHFYNTEAEVDTALRILAAGR